MLDYHAIKTHFESGLYNILHRKIHPALIKNNYRICKDIVFFKYDFISENDALLLYEFYEKSDENIEEIPFLLKKINFLILMHYLYWHRPIDSIIDYFIGNSNLFNLIGNNVLEPQPDLSHFFKISYYGIDFISDNILATQTNNINIPDSFETIAQSQIDLYKKKNSDYGAATDKLFDKFGFEYYQIMLEQKMLRVDSLLKKNDRHNFESLEDSLLDISNYAILAVESLRKQNKSLKNI